MSDKHDLQGTARRCGLALALAIAAGSGSVAGARGSAALASYDVDPARISISGLSSGGYFAMQMGIAYSALFRGVGVLAGGPYDCARAAILALCMYNATPDLGPALANLHAWSGTRIDDLAHVAAQRIYILTGTYDATVGPNVTRQVERLYLDGGIAPAENVRYERIEGAGHTFPTDFDSRDDNPCALSLTPYISNCRFDAAGALLQWIHGTLAPRNTGRRTGALLAFDQTEFVASGKGMSRSGWVYVPTRCAAGAAACGLHVALHGCLQDHATIGDDFLLNTGYWRWADTNGIIVLFPQAVADPESHPTPANGLLPNPQGCWDWLGWYGADYDQKSGVQMRAVRAMIGRVAGAPLAARQVP